MKNEKYQAVGTVPTSNIGEKGGIDNSNTHIHDCFFTGWVESFR